jgi:hypothetical protein
VDIFVPFKGILKNKSNSNELNKKDDNYKDGDDNDDDIDYTEEEYQKLLKEFGDKI